MLTSAAAVDAAYLAETSAKRKPRLKARELERKSTHYAYILKEPAMMAK